MNFFLSPFRRPDPATAESAPVFSEAVFGPSPAAHEGAPTAVERLARRASHLRPLRSYRGTLTTAAVLAALALVTWIAASDVLAGIEGASSWLHDRENMLRRTLVGIALLTLAALALVRAWSHATSLQRPVPISGGRGSIEVVELAAWLSANLEARPGIRTAAVQIENRQPAGVRVDVRVQVEGDADVDGTLDAVDDAAEELLVRRLGVAMDGPPLVDVVYDEFRLGSTG